MKFDFAIGNPPYQDDEEDPLYPFFYNSAEEISTKYLLISPARFLFNAGLTSKEWNKKMLNDEHLKVEYFNQNAADIFQNTDIKGGVAVIYRNSEEKYNAIKEFIPDDNKRKLASYFKKDEEHNFSSIMHAGRSEFKFNQAFLDKYPNTKELRINAVNEDKRKKAKKAKKEYEPITDMDINEVLEIKTSAFEVLSQSFYVNEPENRENFYKIFGLYKDSRVYRWIEKEYLTLRSEDFNNINNYKVYISKAIGSGHFGELMSEPVISYPGETATPSFVSIGSFATEIEAKNAAKYIKTKLVRALLGLLKITQDNVPSKWAYVPIQDFSENSDIDWNQPISNIDNQLYKKYKIDNDIVIFVNSNVKEMN